MATTPPVPILLMAQKLAQGGSERQLAEIAKALDRQRFAPHVAVLREGGLRLDELHAAGVPTVHIPLHSFASTGFLSASWHLYRYLRRHRIQLAHSFDVPSNIFLAPVARAARVLVLGSQRAFRTLTPRHLDPLVWFSDRLVDGLVVNCRAIERHLIEDARYPASRIHLCYNGLDASAFARQNPPPSPELAGASLVIGIVCALRPEKDLLTLLRAFALLHPQYPSARLVFVGSGALLEPLRQLSAELSVQPHCVFVPSTSAVAEWLSRIDIFVLPSRSEALSNSVMEAMACSCAVIASNVGGNPELITHGERGFLFPSGDHHELARLLTLLASNQTLRRQFAAAGRDFITTNFSLARSVQTMTTLYETMLSKVNRAS